MPRPSPAPPGPSLHAPRQGLVGPRPPRGGRAGVLRAAVVSFAVLTSVAACRATTELGPPAATPTDMGGISVALQRAGVRIEGVVSGDPGCPDPALAKTAISFRASGLDQVVPVAVHLFIFNDDAAYQRSRPSVDACARSFVRDPAMYEALDQSPYVLAGQGPWGERFKDGVRAAMLAASGGG